jgi:hypothetical protein
MSVEILTGNLALESSGLKLASLEKVLSLWKSNSSKYYKHLSWDMIQSHSCFKVPNSNINYYKQLSNYLFATFRDFDNQTKKLLDKQEIINRLHKFQNLFNDHIKNFSPNIYLRYLKIFFSKYFGAKSKSIIKTDETKLIKITHFDNLSTKFLSVINRYYGNDPYFSSFTKIINESRKALKINENKAKKDQIYLTFDQMVDLRHSIAKFLLTDFSNILDFDKKIKLEAIIKSYNWFSD